ncbi:MAG: hypothetical protein GY823_11305, partial [Flavobacteriaceae bacterium]|nr:hypothetical protein [Flavobacteriaceae bacterium]
TPGVRYPAILLGADVRTSVFPVTVFEGQEAVSFDGFSILKSKLSSLYILTGALKHQEPVNSIKEMNVPTEVNRNCVVAGVPEVIGEEPVHGDLHVEANRNCVIAETPAAITQRSALPELDPAALAAVGARVDLNRDLDRDEEVEVEEQSSNCTDCGFKRCTNSCQICVDVNQMIVSEAAPFHEPPIPSLNN